MKRSRIAPVSQNRLAVNRERRRLQEAAWGPKNSWRCWFRDRPKSLEIAGPCQGEVWGHEILKRSRAGATDANLLNIEGQVPLCGAHNLWVENFPKYAHEMGLARHAWEK